MSNFTLYVIDARQHSSFTTFEKGVQALENQLPPKAARGDTHVLLQGIDQAQLIIWQRALFQLGIAPAHCHTLLPDSAETLRHVDPVLETQVREHMINALTPTSIIDVATGQPCPRDDDRQYNVRNESNAGLPTLAFVAPLLPQPTGIANYSAELLPYLARHFSITLVVDQPEIDATLSSKFECIDPGVFSRRAHEFDYTLYQMGNSLYHAYQFGLLKWHPGLVVLHDYFLFDAVWWLNESGLKPNALIEQLYADHGYPALIAHADAVDDKRGAEKYPVNGLITRNAAGLVYHSEHARKLADYWQQGSQSPTYQIPHLRQLPPSRDKCAARRVLGLEEDAFVVASFGGINPKKLTHMLVETFLGATFKNARLVLVGAQHGGGYGHTLTGTIKRHSRGQSVTVTGYVDQEHYQCWLAAADVAVQLRTHSRGETSGAIFDAMAHGLPVVANAHGSSAELPKHSVRLLPDLPHDQLASPLHDALAQLHTSADERHRLGRAGREFVATMLSPERIAAQYRDALIDAAQCAPRHRYEHYLDQLADNDAMYHAMRTPEKAKHLTRVLSEADTTPNEQPPRLLFDISTIAWEDLKTGIERVTRKIADHLLRYPPEGWRVELIRWGGDDFYLARGFACDQLGLTQTPGPDVPVEPRPGDRYVTTEWAPPLLKQAGYAMQRMRAQGVRFYFTVHDLLPLSLPECFPAYIPSLMREWFNAISDLADGIVCVSQQVTHTVEAALDAANHKGRYRPRVKHFHLGADFHPRVAHHSALKLHVQAAALKKTDCRWLKRLNQSDGPVLLMVGTIEPRKGHRQVLDALEQCWAEDAPFNLVIVGKQGWDVEPLMARIKRHPQRDKRLFLAQSASDTLLNTLYRRSNVLIAASYGEGFGLPLIEAARHGIHIFARDIAVFREVAGDYADYFHAETPGALAQALKQWANAWHQGSARSSRGMPYLSWQQSAEQWIAAVLDDVPTAEQPASPVQHPTRSPLDADS